MADIFAQILAGEQAAQAHSRAQASSMGQGFGNFMNSFQQGREERKLEDAALTHAEAKMDFLSQQEGFNPATMEQFMGAKKASDKLAIASTAETMFGMRQEQEDRALEMAESQALTEQRKAVARSSGLTADVTAAQLPFAGPKAESDAIKAELDAEQLRLKIEGIGLDPDKLKSERELRNDFNSLPDVKNLRLAQTGFQKVDAIGDKVRKKLGLAEGADISNAQMEQVLVANPELVTAADDLSMIFNFMKTLDPNSVVRESEFKTAADAKAFFNENVGLAEQPVIKGIVAKLFAGERLLPSQKAEMINSARLNLNQQVEVASPTIRQFTNIEQRGKFDKGFIVQNELQDLIRVKAQQTQPAQGALIESPSAQITQSTQTDPAISIADLRDGQEKFGGFVATDGTGNRIIVDAQGNKLGDLN